MYVDVFVIHLLRLSFFKQRNFLLLFLFYIFNTVFNLKRDKRVLLKYTMTRNNSDICFSLYPFYILEIKIALPIHKKRYVTCRKISSYRRFPFVVFMHKGSIFQNFQQWAGINPQIYSDKYISPEECSSMIQLLWSINLALDHKE